MSGPRVIGLLSIAAGALVLSSGLSALASLVRLSIVEPIVIAVGGGLVLLGVLALKVTLPASRHASSIAASELVRRTETAGAAGRR